jgi:hypothetical protein
MAQRIIGIGGLSPATNCCNGPEKAKTDYFFPQRWPAESRHPPGSAQVLPSLKKGEFVTYYSGLPREVKQELHRIARESGYVSKFAIPLRGRSDRATTIIRNIPQSVPVLV